MRDSLMNHYEINLGVILEFYVKTIAKFLLSLAYHKNARRTNICHIQTLEGANIATCFLSGAWKNCPEVLSIVIATSRQCASRVSVFTALLFLTIFCLAFRQLIVCFLEESFSAHTNRLHSYQFCCKSKKFPMRFRKADFSEVVANSVCVVCLPVCLLDSFSA